MVSSIRVMPEEGLETPDTRIMTGWRQGSEGSDRPSQAEEGDLSSPGSRDLGARLGARRKRKRRRPKKRRAPAL
jgi:hypothetical protein